LNVTAADREHVVTLLNAAFSEGHLLVVERDARIEAAKSAQIFDDLIPLTRDLLALSATYPAPIASTATPFAPAATPLAPTATPLPPTVTAPVGEDGWTPVVQQPSHPQPGGDPAGPAENVVAVFSGASRSGVWTVKPHISVFTLFGGADLDFSEARFTSSPVVVNIFCMFGGVEITVPVGTTIHNSATAIFGGVDLKKIAAPIAGAPTIIVKGLLAFGGATIKHPKRKKFFFND
jgi:hypothetical protein